MSWKEANVVSERARFVLEWKRRWEAGRGRVEVAELCRLFGVSRQTGYVWIRRFRDAGFDVRALESRSSRPRRSPTAISEAVQDVIVATRKAFPKWGPRKLRAWLVDRYPGRQVPSASSIANILQRRGLTVPKRRRRRQRRAPDTAPFAPALAANAVWCIDFKGKFRTTDGRWCTVLTVIDAFSRYCIACEVVENPDTRSVQHVLDRSFRAFGTPHAIRSDNGPPFAAQGPAGLSQLAVPSSRSLSRALASCSE
jgi:putative transposase